MYLLDTNVISELRRAKPHGAVVAWLANVPGKDLYVSAVTIGEIQQGIELTRTQSPVRAAEIEAWLDKAVKGFEVLAMDGACFRCWARLLHERPRQLSEDAMIAATAIVHDLVVVTRNIRDFAPFGVRTVNPFVAKR